MTQFTPVSGFFGGMIIGLAVVVLLISSGRITGISGFLGQPLFEPIGKHVFRYLFIIGIFLGTFLWRLAGHWNDQISIEASTLIVILGGFLVGFGTRLGSGCTSGHGICGNARLSKRSVTATLTFFMAALGTVFVARHVLGGV